jgi:hypothetical protein
MESIMALSLLAGLQLGTDAPRSAPLAAARTLLVAVACARLLLVGATVPSLAPANANAHALEAFLARQPPAGPVISNTATPVVRLGLDPLLVDPVSLAYLEAAGRWDSSELLRWIIERRAGYVIVVANPPGEWPAGFPRRAHPLPPVGQPRARRGGVGALPSVTAQALRAPQP